MLIDDSKLLKLLLKDLGHFREFCLWKISISFKIFSPLKNAQTVLIHKRVYIHIHFMYF